MGRRNCAPDGKRKTNLGVRSRPSRSWPAGSGPVLRFTADIGAGGTDSPPKPGGCEAESGQGFGRHSLPTQGPFFRPPQGPRSYPQSSCPRTRDARVAKRSASSPHGAFSATQATPVASCGCPPRAMLDVLPKKEQRLKPSQGQGRIRPRSGSPALGQGVRRGGRICGGEPLAGRPLKRTGDGRRGAAGSAENTMFAHPWAKIGAQCSDLRIPVPRTRMFVSKPMLKVLSRSRGLAISAARVSEHAMPDSSNTPPKGRNRAQGGVGRGSASTSVDRGLSRSTSTSAQGLKNACPRVGRHRPKGLAELGREDGAGKCSRPGQLRPRRERNIDRSWPAATNL